MLLTAPYFWNNLEPPVILQIWNQRQSCQMALCPNIWLVFDQLCCKYWSDLANQTSFLPSRKAFGWYSIVQLSIVFGASRSSGNSKKQWIRKQDTMCTFNERIPLVLPVVVVLVVPPFVKGSLRDLCPPATAADGITGEYFLQLGRGEIYCQDKLWN